MGIRTRTSDGCIEKAVAQLRHTASGGIANLKVARGLADGTKNAVPDTIKDAMDMCRRIGIPYLWVDAICLDQDNITKTILDSMGRIYQGAYVTLVAAAGSDSWAGLSGLGRPRSNAEGRITEDVGHVSLGLYPGPASHIMQENKWNTRAWTYQEMFLSKRLFHGGDTAELCQGDSRQRRASEHVV